MTIEALDHVNIRTAELAASIRFYGDLLGLQVVSPPMADDLTRGAYCLDEGGRAVVHLVATSRMVAGSEPVRGAAQRGMIDHLALRCRGDSAALKQRLADAGLIFDAMDVESLGQHLVFVRDPNGILVELNFPLDQAG
ncbi:MAG: glyoxalase [Porticoccaceae bacterium]|nr:glyoxalase [Porticoccaceae bacterium]